MSAFLPNEMMSEALFSLHRSKVREERLRKHAEASIELTQAMQRLHRASSDSAETATARPSIWEFVAPILCKHLGAESLWLLAAKGEGLLTVKTYGVGSSPLRWPGSGFFERCLKGQTVLLGDLVDIPALSEHAVNHTGLARSAICAPLLGVAIPGMVMATHREPYSFGAPQRQLMRHLIERVSLELAAEFLRCASAEWEADGGGVMHDAEAPNTLLDLRNMGIPSVLQSQGEGVRDPIQSPYVIHSDRYEVLDLIGRGGVGSVYKAHDCETEQTVAIKVLHDFVEGFADKEAEHIARHRFDREINITSSIKHPNIIEILDSGVFKGGQPFMVMRMLDGADLSVLIHRDGAARPQRAVSLFIPALRALGEVHAKGVVHRDLKPSNLFLATVQERQVLQILDFGLARHSGKSDVTRVGTLPGTPRYMSPEYITEGAVFPQTDVYQMGLILAEWITGKPVVDADSDIGVIYAHFQGQVTVPDILEAGPLRDILERALAHDYVLRHANGAEFADELEALTF